MKPVFNIHGGPIAWLNDGFVYNIGGSPIGYTSGNSIFAFNAQYIGQLESGDNFIWDYPTTARNLLFPEDDEMELRATFDTSNIPPQPMRLLLHHLPQ